jgi:hypothetical protein
MYRSAAMAALGGWLLAASAPLAYQPELVSPSVSEPISDPASNDDPLLRNQNGSPSYTQYDTTPCEACESQPDACDCQPTYHGECCDHGSGWGLCPTDCCLGDAWTVKDCLTPCCDSWNYAGWVQIGYHDHNERLSFDPGDLAAFNDRPHELNLHQAYVYFEKIANPGACSADWGARFDILYGIDAQKTQAFGNDDNVWDVSLDHGPYGWAMPQAYLEFAYDNWTIKAGHFYTTVGYEVVPATGNFFYSHSLTMFNTEPFTHTGILATASPTDAVTLYAGWTAGWDTGFDRNDNGSNFLGGFGVQFLESMKYTYICTAGDFGWRGEGYQHSNVLDITLSDCWQYVVQSDYLDTDFVVEDGAENQEFGVNQYLFYTLNDCWSLGSRMEWWKSNRLTGEMTSYYELTGGINYRPHANLTFRPEIRYDWTPSEDAIDDELGEDYNQVTFGIDAILTF